MKSFLILLKKEINELLTIQTIIPMIIIVLIFVFIGKVIGNESKKAKTSNIKIYIIDYDNSMISKGFIKYLNINSIKVLTFGNLEKISDDEKYLLINFLKGKNKISNNLETGFNDLVKTAKLNKVNTILFIPPGFGDNILKGKKIKVYPFSILTSFSIVKLSSSKQLNVTTFLLKKYIDDLIFTRLNKQLNDLKKGEEDKKNVVYNTDFIKNPLIMNYSLYVNKKIANVRPEVIGGFVISQSVVVPIVIFMIIIFSTQMIATSIASEKENKTLETLLSMPIKRTHIVIAKMLGAGIVSMLMAIIYIIGFRYYLNGITGGGFSAEQMSQLKPIIEKLGLVLNVYNYIILGLSIFGAVLCALALALIIGVFAEDVKQVQALITPIIVILMIPYILSMFLDINSVSPVLRYIIYAIPFAHPFFATTNLFFGYVKPVLYGIAYEFLIFSLLIIIAAKIFSSDKILTMKLKLKKRK